VDSTNPGLLGKWQRVIFSDESRFEMVNGRPERCWTKEVYNPECLTDPVKHGGDGMGLLLPQWC